MYSTEDLVHRFITHAVKSFGDGGRNRDGESQANWFAELGRKPSNCKCRDSGIFSKVSWQGFDAGSGFQWIAHLQYNRTGKVKNTVREL